MPHALLLSPDDQAVSAISAVLEEMSVTCERPLDGVSAAQKLNSQSFDLVLVDCENLPAAKLVFDVCRRGKNGINPVPIAIVDGRAGLPTAFRLGAELILTKPVAKDQARNTVRNAVSRVRKEGQANESVPTPPPAATLHHAVGTVEHAQAFAAAAVSSQLTNFADTATSHVSAQVSDAASDAAPNAALDAASTMLSAPASTATMHSAVDEIFHVRGIFFVGVISSAGICGRFAPPALDRSFRRSRARGTGKSRARRITTKRIATEEFRVG